MSSDIIGALGIVEQIQKRIPRKSEEKDSDISVGSVLAALNSFTDIVRYLNTRRSTGAILDLSNEAAVQDALYLMLRPWILDLVPETPTEKVANRFSIKDFVSKGGHFVIEAKFVRDASHGKSLAKEINDDIETYRYHPSCDDLIFFIYDPNGHIPDSASLERHVRTSRSYDGRMLRCYGVIKP
ncbi:hypothetical protein [Afipia felis]|uniref:PD-(D/E)XK nuclease domain-containing protein n=1 Tax=Afipia felis TaxID=1035 RepID=UPI0012E2224E|nr:hypothetical protein [Afipia felis]